MNDEPEGSFTHHGPLSPEITLSQSPDEEGCHAIYAQDLLPTFELEVHQVVWEQLEWEWINGLNPLVGESITSEKEVGVFLPESKQAKVGVVRNAFFNRENIFFGVP